MNKTDKRLGTVVRTKRGLLQGIITLVDGSRKRLKPFPKGTSEEMARERTHVKALQARELGAKKPALANLVGRTRESGSRVLLHRSNLGGFKVMSDDTDKHAIVAMQLLYPSNPVPENIDDAERECARTLTETERQPQSPRSPRLRRSGAPLRHPPT